MFSEYGVDHVSIPKEAFNLGKRNGDYQNLDEFQEYVDTILNEPDFQEENVKYEINAKDLIPIFHWGDGDYHFYSIRENQFYNFDYGMGIFEKTQIGR